MTDNRKAALIVTEADSLDVYHYLTGDTDSYAYTANDTSSDLLRDLRIAVTAAERWYDVYRMIDRSLGGDDSGYLRVVADAVSRVKSRLAALDDASEG